MVGVGVGGADGADGLPLLWEGKPSEGWVDRGGRGESGRRDGVSGVGQSPELGCLMDPIWKVIIRE